jgi:hypothetical protein
MNRTARLAIQKNMKILGRLAIQKKFEDIAECLKLLPPDHKNNRNATYGFFFTEITYGLTHVHSRQGRGPYF